MCLVKAPKVAPAAAEKDPPILRNPFLDGLDGVTRSQRLGVSSLTIQRTQPGTAVAPPPGALSSLTVAPPAASTAAAPSPDYLRSLAGGVAGRVAGGLF